jgi:hypothetical protein
MTRKDELERSLACDRSKNKKHVSSVREQIRQIVREQRRHSFGEQRRQREKEKCCVGDEMR